MASLRTRNRRDGSVYHAVLRVGPAVARAGLKPRPRVHDLRHTCARWMVAAGVPLPVVQTHLGLESINTTISLYCHIDRRSQEAAATAIAAMLDPSS